MAGEKVKLYGMKLSPFTNRVEIALTLKGVEYEFIEEDLQNKSPDLLKYNPVHKKVPVLVHGNKAVAESQVILEYIDEVWSSGPSLFPRDPYHRAQARFWARFVDDKILQSIIKVYIKGEKEAMEEVVANLKVIDKELEGKKFLGGEGIGFADIVANILGYWLLAIEEAIDETIVSREAFPSICKWRDEFETYEDVKVVLPQREKLAVVIRTRLSATKTQTSK